MYFKTIDFSKYSSLKIGSIHSVAVIESVQDSFDGVIIGAAFNLLVSNNPPPLAILGKEFDYIKEEDGFIKIGAATMAGRVYSYAKANNIAGFEYLAHLPGTMGGLIAMNAGMKEYEIFNNLRSVLFSNGYKNANEIEHGYRFAKLNSIAYEAVFIKKDGFDATLVELFAKMRANQPKEPSAGSFFKNPPNDYAGRLLETVGLKGHKIGGVAFSEKHANFLVNLGGASFDDAFELINLAKKRVYEKFKITLENEVKII